MMNQTEKPTPLAESDNQTSSTPAERLQALHEFAKSGANDPDRFVSAALNDKDNEVRCAAIAYLSDLPTLESLLKQKGKVQDAASLQYHKIISGVIPSDLSAENRVQAIASLSPKSVKQVALLAKCKKAGAAALSRIKDNQDLADLCLFAAIVYVRKTAAEKIEDIDLINELIQKTEGKDKTVFKVLSSKSPDTKPLDTKPLDTKSAKTKSLNTELSTTEPLPNKKSVEPIATEKSKQTTAADDAKTDIKQQVKQTTQKHPAKPVTEKERLEVIARFDGLTTEINNLYTEIPKLSFKNTGQLNKLAANLKKLKQKIGWPETLLATDDFQVFVTKEKILLELITKNRNYQSQLAQSTNEIIESLKTALEEGNTTSASQLWDKIQSNISNTGGQISRELTEKTNEIKAKLNELKDWKNFAATEKKKELITQMQHLLDSKMHPTDKSKRINKLHREWKLLGHSSQNEKLWRQFKTSSDKAYEPCKEFFKLQKQVMSNNLKQRNSICGQMESYLTTIDQSTIDLGGLKKVENQARDEWKQYAPVENSKIKKLQKRFYAIMDQLRKIKRTALQVNVEAKKALISRAEELIDLEDNRDAMNKAKSLQAEWQQIGPSSFKDDKKYWEAFRAACDKIFAKRDSEKQQVQAEIEAAIKEVNKILTELEGILNQNEDEFRESRKLFSTLQRNFRDALSHKIKKERKQLLTRFDNTVGKIENRFRKLPDKKLQQATLSLNEKAAICLELETSIFACKNDDDLGKVKDKIDDSMWINMQSSNNLEMDKAMDDRFQSLKNIATINQFQALIQKNESEARNKVVWLEIKANLDSPDSDKGLRMQVQLNQLKANFGRISNDKENSKFARDFELEFLCFGPLDRTIREEMERRVEKAVNKLI